jgi:hypothetical protein
MLRLPVAGPALPQNGEPVLGQMRVNWVYT